VTKFDESSRCSGGRRVYFRWYGFPTCAVGGDLEAATEAFFIALAAPDRVWSPHSKAMAKMEFQRRLQKAELGKLRPVTDVKPIDVDNPPPLYEIRWQTIAVTTRTDGVLNHRSTIVRLYHSEPASHPAHFIGHHVHEKVLATDHIYRAQDEEIQISKRFFDAGVPSSWGIAT